VNFKIDLIGRREGFRIKIVRHRDELNGPAFDKKAFFSKIGISLILEVGEDWSKRDQACLEPMA
jgi:hypothetical protein